MIVLRKGMLPLIALVVVMTTGCGKRTVQVSGSVNFKEKPLPVAKIIFVDATGKSVTGDILEGKFTVANVPVGNDVKVVVTTSPLVQELSDFEGRKKLQSEIPGPPGMELPLEVKQLQDVAKVDPELDKLMADLKQRLVLVPTRYETAETTPLTYKIGSKAEELSIRLEE